MAKFVVDLCLDGYNSQEEMEEACMTFMEEQLDFSASSVNIVKLKDYEIDHQAMWQVYEDWGNQDKLGLIAWFIANKEKWLK